MADENKIKEKENKYPTDIEVRCIPADEIELREDGDGIPKIMGYAARFNKWSEDLGGFREKIAPGAFDNALKTSDVRALKNHDPNLILGRTSSGTLSLVCNRKGLSFTIDTPNTSTGNDTVEEIRRKDITGCSFAFTTAEDDWRYNKDGSVERTIIEVRDLFDVGPVTYPAYPDTSVAARTLELFKEERREDPEVEEVEGPDVPPEDAEIIEENNSSPIDAERQKDINRKYRKLLRIKNRCTEAIESMKSAKD
jgi:HK97 family phage prohead protease